MRKEFPVTEDLKVAVEDCPPLNNHRIVVMIDVEQGVAVTAITLAEARHMAMCLLDAVADVEDGLAESDDD